MSYVQSGRVTKPKAKQSKLPKAGLFYPPKPKQQPPGQTITRAASNITVLLGVNRPSNPAAPDRRDFAPKHAANLSRYGTSLRFAIREGQNILREYISSWGLEWPSCIVQVKATLPNGTYVVHHLDNRFGVSNMNSSELDLIVWPDIPEVDSRNQSKQADYKVSGGQIDFIVNYSRSGASDPGSQALLGPPPEMSVPRYAGNPPISALRYGSPSLPDTQYSSQPPSPIAVPPGLGSPLRQQSRQIRFDTPPPGRRV